MLASLISLALTAAVAPAGCEVDRAAVLKLSPKIFDDRQRGWRPLGDRPGCYPTAAELIAAYRKAHWAELTPSELHINYWHEAQMRAAAGDTRKAVPLFLDGVDPDAFGSADYALATVAFLNHDLAALKAARARLALTPKPPGYDKDASAYEAAHHVKLDWPPNLDVVDGFIACFDKPYAVAYGFDCRPK